MVGTLIVVGVRSVGGDVGKVFRRRLDAGVPIALIAVPLLLIE